MGNHGEGTELQQRFGTSNHGRSVTMVKFSPVSRGQGQGRRLEVQSQGFCVYMHVSTSSVQNKCVCVCVRQREEGRGGREGRKCFFVHRMK